MSSGLIDKGRIEIKYGDYGIAPSTALTDLALLPAVQDYRRQTGSRMYPLDRDDITRKIPNADYHVSRKVDGEFTVLIYRNGQAVTLNPGGTVRVGLPWQQEAAELLAKAGFNDILVAGELYVTNDQNRRSRVHDVTSVARQPASVDDLSRLRFAVFDLISIDGESINSPFDETWKSISKVFSAGSLVHPVESAQVNDANKIKDLFEKWVDGEGAEGLVVRSDTAGLFKIKPRHTLDAAVIGFTESTDDRQGMMHDLLLAIMRRDGALQVLGRVGGGFSEDLRREMLSDLKDMIVDSEYAEVNSDHVAYQMVRPDWVIEISCLDLISQTTRGGPVNRMVLNWNTSENRYQVVRRLPLVSVISPQFVRRRGDKKVNADDVRIDQIATVVEVPMSDRDASQLALAKSEVLRREVFTKQLQGGTMVRKFMMWKTNKENESEDFPAYVVHFTDFSPNRKTPLSREVRVSNSHDQIIEQWDMLKESNIKQGWRPAGPADTVEKSAERAKTKPVNYDSKTEKPSKDKAADKQAAGKKTAKKKTVKKKTAKKKVANKKKTKKND